MPESPKTLTLPADAVPKRLDRILREAFPGVPPRALRDFIARGGAKDARGRTLAKGKLLGAGETIVLDNLPETSALAVLPEPDLPLAVVFEDDEIVALDKPSGMPVHPQRIGEKGTLLNALVARCPACAAIGPDPLFAAFLHRIDIATSGLVLAAKTPEAYEALRRQFRARTVEKTYLAWVEGTAEDGKSAATLTHRTRHPCRMRAVREGETLPRNELFSAESRWKVRERRGGRTLLEVTIFSGVTHQIRCHLAESGHPVAGDRLYGSHTPLPRHLLHAWRIRFRHPATGKETSLAAPPPAGFAPPVL
ncbi:MAG: RluA family pseudouridine synthase [Kiritimatiellae bacterium]|nr:RluA family pseudouridine synthase [Kiritimatiellia bacterium]